MIEIFLYYDNNLLILLYFEFEKIIFKYTKTRH